MTEIEISNLSKHFIKDGKPKPVLKDLSLTIKQGEFVCLVGPNGSGKSTLLNLVAGLLSADSGTVAIRGISGARPRIGYAFQDYRSSLLPWRSAIGNLAFPLEATGTDRAERHRVAGALLERFAPEIPPGEPIINLSGGQQQLISAMRGFIAEPDIVLLDEPLSALDQHRRWQLGRHIEQVWSISKPPTILVSHDVDEAVLLGDKIVMLGYPGSGDVSVLSNELEHPRSLSVLTAKRHLELRNQIVEHLNAASQAGV